MKGLTVLAMALAANLLLGLNHAHGATLYRWTDAQGKPVISDRPPPPGVEYETVSASSSMVNKVNSADPVTPREPPKPPSSSTEAAETRRTVYEKNPSYCAQARKNLEVIESAARIRMPDANGEMRYISDDEKAREREKNLETIEMHCD